MAQITRKTSLSHLETESIGGYSQTTSITSEMHFKDNVRTLYERVQAALRRRKEKKAVDISEPFDLKRLTVSIPGVSQEELVILREKAAASRIGIAEDSMFPDPLSSNPIPRRARSPYARSPSPFSVVSTTATTQPQQQPSW